MKLKLIILWIRVKRQYAKVKITLSMLKFCLYIHILRFVWNNIISPLYFRYESRVVGLIESNRVNAQDFVVPMRLTYYSSPVVIEDRYDYSHEDGYTL